MKRLVDLFQRKEVRFIFVGGINTIVGYGTFALCILLGAHYSVAQLISTIVGVTNSYFFNKYFTFRQKKKSLKEVLRFLLVYAISYTLNLGILYVLVDLMKQNAYIAGAIGLFSTTVISYVGHNKFSFSRGK